LKRVAFLAALAMVSLDPGRAIGDDATKAKAMRIAGDWEGRLKVNPQVSLRITLKVADKDGNLSGTWGSPDEGLEGLPLGPIALKDDVLTFTTKHGVTYKGKRNATGTEVAGNWTQRGRDFPLTFKRYDPSKAPAAPPIPKELEGFWEGKLKVAAGIELRLVLKVEKGKEGRLKAELASPDQGANNIPISTIELKADTLTFESKIIGAKYSGKKNKDRTAFEGQFTQGGLKLPLVLKKTDKLSVAPRPQTPKPPFPYRSEEVAYENKAGGAKLAGTLTLPGGRGPFAAVLLLTGSGPQDRDETILGHKPFLVIADALTRRGIAVLRVDDRGVGGSSGSGSSSTTDDFAGDALAGVAYLKDRKEIDAGKIGLIGHSEGGLIAPLAASRSRDVAFIVLMAGTGLPGKEILRAQGLLVWKAEGLSEVELKSAQDIQQRVMDIFLEEKDEKAARAKLAATMKEVLAAMPKSVKKAAEESGGLSEAAVDRWNNAWFRSFVAYDPRPTLKKVRCPVLAINGERDLQVPPKDNLGEIEKALKAGGNLDVTAIEFAGLNHLFQPCKTGSPSEYARIETTIAPEVLKAIGDWIVEKTGPRAGKSVESRN
jgi:pimeloyl-ACP methyl ester carboxylesterase